MRLWGWGGLALFGVLFTTAGLWSTVWTAWLGGVLLGGGLLGGLVVSGRWSERWADRLPPALHEFGAASRSLLGRPALPGALGLTLVARFGEAGLVYLLARWLDLGLSYPEAALVLGVAGLAGGVSALPGGLGAAEATIVGLVVSLGGQPNRDSAWRCWRGCSPSGSGWPWGCWRWERAGVDSWPGCHSVRWTGRERSRWVPTGRPASVSGRRTRVARS